MTITTLLRTIISAVLIALAVILFVPPALFVACLPARWRYDNRLFFWALDLLYKSGMYALLLPVHVKNRQFLPKTEPVIFVANHQSALDIPVFGSLCNGHSHVWLVLSYYLRTPVLGFLVGRMFVPVDRNHPSRAARSLIETFRFIQNKNRHMLIFPEGARRTDGKIHKFFDGFAVLAKRTGRKVIPVLMPNNGKIFPPGSYYARSYPIIVEIGEPFYIGPTETEQEFTQRVRQWFVDTMERYHE